MQLKWFNHVNFKKCVVVFTKQSSDLLSHYLLLSWQPAVWLHCVCICVHFLITNPLLWRRFTCQVWTLSVGAVQLQSNQPRWLFNDRSELPLKSFSQENIFIMCLLNTYLSTYIPIQQFLPHSHTVWHRLFFSRTCAWLVLAGKTAVAANTIFSARLLIMFPLLSPRDPALVLEGSLGSMNCQEDLWRVLLLIAQTPVQRLKEGKHANTHPHPAHRPPLLIKIGQAPQEICTCLRQVLFGVCLLLCDVDLHAGLKDRPKFYLTREGVPWSLLGNIIKRQAAISALIKETNRILFHFSGCVFFPLQTNHQP